MLRNKATALIVGLLAGIVLAGAATWVLMPKMMLQVFESRYGFDQTVTTIEDAIKAAEGWKSPITLDIQKNIVMAGNPDMTKVKVVTLCNPNLAHRILADDADKKTSGVMPVTIGVYEDSAGRTYIAVMDYGLMGSMFGGTIADVMATASGDLNGIVATAAK
jgi:uncharacterized protein (DUF302 family)